jgi:hypothetical protein
LYFSLFAEWKFSCLENFYFAKFSTLLFRPTKLRQKISPFHYSNSPLFLTFCFFFARATLITTLFFYTLIDKAFICWRAISRLLGASHSLAAVTSRSQAPFFCTKKTFSHLSHSTKFHLVASFLLIWKVGLDEAFCAFFCWSRILEVFLMFWNAFFWLVFLLRWIGWFFGVLK